MGVDWLELNFQHTKRVYVASATYDDQINILHID